MSTKSTIHEILSVGEPRASVHVFTEAFDDSGDIHIESWLQGDKTNYCERIVIRKDVWAKLVDEIRAR